MKTLIVLGIILAVLLLIGSIPVGVDAVYDPEGFKLRLRIWRFSVGLGGNKKEASEKKKKPEDGEQKEEEPEKKKRRLPPLGFIRILAENGIRTLTRLVSRLKTEILRIHFTSAFEDPAVTAIAYGAAGTAMEGILRAGEGRIRHSDLKAFVDFDSSAPTVDFRICIVIRIGRIVHEVLRFGFCFLIDFIRYKREVKNNG